jgi:thiamine-phosphate pyrophosphorylase
VGIGGLNESNAAEVIRNGADGVAVVSAIVAADDPETAAMSLKQIIDEARNP